MPASVCCGAAWPAPAQLRGRSWRLATPLLAAFASRVAQGVSRRVLLDNGCAVRARLPLAVVAAGTEPPIRRGRPRKTVDSEAVRAEPPVRTRRAGNAGEPVASERTQAEPPKRKSRALSVGERGETTPDGRPKPDERTVAYLVRRGWFKSEQEAQAALTRDNYHRYPVETAGRTADWLDATLGPEPVKDGLSPAARIVSKYPEMLSHDAANLQHKWNALTLPISDGGVGIVLSTEQAREVICKHPQIMKLGVDTYSESWSMLTSENGLKLSPKEAHKCILRGPAMLRHNCDTVVRRIKLLESLGYAEARRMVEMNPTLINYKEETVREHHDWWRQTGLDHAKLIKGNPGLLGVCSTEVLQAKLDFLSRVVGMSNEHITKAALFTRSLDGTLRARYFYALLKNQLARFKSMSTLLGITDAAFLAMLQGGVYRVDVASEADVKRYQQEVASAEFVAWREQQEARILRGRLHER